MTVPSERFWSSRGIKLDYSHALIFGEEFRMDCFLVLVPTAKEGAVRTNPEIGKPAWASEDHESEIAPKRILINLG